jgi:hypothetical protein
MAHVNEHHPGRRPCFVGRGNLPPLSWKMGRIIEVHPAKDNRVRVVKVKTASGTTKRTVNKVCVLPKDE